MSAWNDGYIFDSNYTYGYYGEMFPARLRFLLAATGFVPPEAFEKGGTACELGFGHGMSMNINAVSSPLTWYGTDFNPEHAVFTRRTAAASGAAVTVVDQSFEEFCLRDDLPDFDFICLHGIWSWISVQNQKIILDFIHRKLKAGGIVYISYNCAPGLTPYSPMREIFREYTTRMVPAGQSSTLSAQQSIAFMEQILELEPLYDKLFPHHKAKLELIKKQDKQYVPHEYLNQYWQIISFPNLARQMEKVGLSYLCSASPKDHVPSLKHSSNQINFLNRIPDTGLREFVSDFMNNNNFRWDIWGKGLERISPEAQINILQEQQVVLLQPAQDVQLTIQGKMGKGTLKEDLYRPILDSLDGGRIKTAAELAGEKKNLPRILESILCLAGNGALGFVTSHDRMKVSRKESIRLNRFLLSLPREQAACLSSPLVGGVAVGVPFRMFLAEFLSGTREIDQLTRNILQQMKNHGQTFTVEGKKLTDDTEALAWLKQTAEEFFEKMLPLYKALGIIEK